ncbi:unnamed protein product [Pylaiella littoralis]
MVAFMSPPGVVSEGGGAAARQEDSFKSGGGNSSPRARTRLSGMGRKSRRGSDADNAPDASSRALDEGSTRRVSSVPTRARHSMGVSRFSLPSNMSPPKAFTAKDGAQGLPRNEAGAAWEGLMLTHPLTGDEKNLTFMEFAVIGLSPSTLAGSHPLQPWGQDPEVVSGFPSRGENAAGSGRGKGDGSFVQGLGEFCFPRGASVALVEREAVSGTLEAVPDDRMHLVQFTDCENASTYGCCVTVTEVLQDPSPRLVERLRERERMHAAARTLQRCVHQFMRSTCCSSVGGRQRGGSAGGGGTGGGAGYRSTTPTSGRHWEDPSLFEVQTPPPDADSSSAVAAPVDLSAASDHSPTSFSMMVNRLFTSNPGADSSSEARIGNATVMVDGMAPSTNASTAVRTYNGAAVAEACGASLPPSTSADGARSPVKSSGAPAAGAAPAGVPAATGYPSRTSARASAFASSPIKRRSPSSPGPMTRTAPYLPASSAAARSRSAGLYRGGNVDIRGMVREKSSNGGGTSDKLSGMFSDDESDSDAVYSTDRDDSFDGDVGTSGDTDKTSAGNSLFEAPGGLGRRHPANSSRMRAANGTGTPAGVTVRNRPAYPRGAAVATATGVALPRARAKPTWYVLVETCYVMISCHRNHPLMFKVLKAVVDAERPTRQVATTSSPPHILGGARKGGLGSLSRPRLRSGNGIGANGSVVMTDRPRSAGKLKSVAAAAAEVAKGRHRRMLRDKFLHQIRTDKSCTEEGKISVHCPAFLRAPLELTSTALELWSTAVLFGCVSEQTALRALDVLLLEKTLVVCGRDLGMVSTVATALLSLLDPFKWEGVFVPVVPRTLMDVLDSPVPALVGVQAPFDKLNNAFDGLVVLDLDARQSSTELYMAGMDEKLPVSEELVDALKNANTFRGRGRGAGAPQEERSPVRKGDRGNGPKAPSSRVMGNGGAGGGAHGGRGGGLSMSHGPRSHFAFQATTFMTGEKPWRQILHYSYASKVAVVRLRSLVRGHVSALCGDLGVSEMWRKYGAFNSATNHFEFHPDWFTGPLEERLRFQVRVARTQMFVSFVERCRQKDMQVAEENSEGRRQTPTEPPPPPPPPPRPASSANRGGRGEGVDPFPPFAHEAF